MEKGQQIVVEEIEVVAGWVRQRTEVDYAYVTDPETGKRQSRRIERKIDQPLERESYRVATVERVTPQGAQFIVEGQRFNDQGYPYGNRYNYRNRRGVIVRAYPRFATVQAKYDADAYEKVYGAWTDARYSTVSRVYIDGADEHERAVLFAERALAATFAFPDVLDDAVYQDAATEALKAYYDKLVRALLERIETRARTSTHPATNIRAATATLTASVPVLPRRDRWSYREEVDATPQPEEPEIDLPLFSRDVTPVTV